MQRLSHDSRVTAVLCVLVDTHGVDSAPSSLCYDPAPSQVVQAPTLGDTTLNQQLLSNLMHLSTLSEGTVPSFSEILCMKLSLVSPARQEDDISSLNSSCAISHPCLSLSVSLLHYTQAPFVPLWESYLNTSFEEL